ncbi:unnamed protein product [Thelazia callipaeda]|uniref:Protein kinase domain-containing protein n=1 Tax=Thelazia callipaeda TaxID=103827 RepID=A0A0N5CWB2_THECL|nr:unnamed protein product [Thelazia callipaeda]
MAFLKRLSSNFITYWKTVCSDYMAVIGDLAEDAKKRPILMALKILPLSVAFYAYKTNQTESDMLNFLIEKRHELILLPNSMHNKRADDELALRTLYINQGRLKLFNCIFFSVLIKYPDNYELCLYRNQSSILRRWWWQRYDDIVDICVFGNWLLFRNSFKNYDINENNILFNYNVENVAT